MMESFSAGRAALEELEEEQETKEFLQDYYWLCVDIMLKVECMKIGTSFLIQSQILIKSIGILITCATLGLKILIKPGLQ